MRKIKVLIVDDSFFMRKLLSEIVEETGVLEVVGVAKDGVEALEKVKKLHPDVITLDVEMPKMNGLDVLKEIMRENPTPVIMLSSLTRSGSDATIRALELGAFDFLHKPSGSISLDIRKIKQTIADKIILAHSQKEKIISQWNDTNLKKKRSSNIKSRVTRKLEKPSSELEGIVAIGTSTGGPKALHEVITKIPKDIPYGILIVQHMPAGFTKSLANRLDSMSEIEVVEAEDNQEIKKGVAYIAPGGYHMIISRQGKGYKICLNKDEPISGHRPSVDVLFESLKNIILNKIFVVMTGMGSDGADGIARARDKKCDIIIAEDEASCVVYGMPKSVITRGLADEVILLENIADGIVESVNKQRRCL